jgi:hypothetical protein
MINEYLVELDHELGQHGSARTGVDLAIAGVGDPEQEVERLKAVHEARVKIVPRV